MACFKWLQISDFHFKTKDSFDMSNARKKLLEKLKEDNIKPDYLFITGDIADKNVYASSKEYLEDLLNTVELSKDKVFWAVGNHDIKRGTGHRAQIIKKIREDKNPSQVFEVAMADEEERVILTQIGMSSYIKEYKKILDRELSANEILDAHIHYDLPELNLIVLNTCLTSSDDEDSHKLMITEQRLFHLFDKIKTKNKPIIVMGHHGKTFFHPSEQNRLGHLFEDGGVDLYLCGHSHRLGYDRFDESGRDIPQFTCGGGNVSDGYSVFTFMVGEYNSVEHTVTITPYSYSERGGREFNKDYTLSRRLTEFNNTFPLSRLLAATATVNSSLKQSAKDKTSPKMSLADADLFARSQRHYDFMRSEQGRFSFLEVEKGMFPGVKAKGSSDELPRELLEILHQSETDILVIGDGGMGKTTSLLDTWETHLKNKTRLPLYIPLNDYQQQRDFIRDYIKRYYGNIDLEQLARDFLLLLDGFNEISGATHLLIAELKNLLLKHRAGRIRVIITSRHDFIEDYQLESFQSYQLLPLDEDVVKKYVDDKNLPLENAAIDVLKTPMMLSLYTETCNIQLHSAVKNKNLFEFKDNNRRGEMLYNFLLCQVAKSVISGRLEEIASTWRALFSVAPYIAYQMESKGKFHISKEKFSQLESDYSKENMTNNQILPMPEPLQSLLSRSGSLDSYSESAENILLYRQYLLIEENKQYSFRHQYFRDFFATLHIINTIENTIEDYEEKESIEPLELTLSSVLSNKLWTIYVRDMLGDYYGDYKNKERYSHHTPLHELLGKLRNRSHTENGLAVNNILETWRRCRDDRIVGENLTSLDLSRVPLNGVMFYSHNRATYFDGSKIADATLLAQGHSASVNSTIYSPDGQKILSASFDTTIKEWDLETGECLRTFTGHTDSVNSAIYSPDGQKILSASKDTTIKEWDRKKEECLCTFAGHSTSILSAIYSPDGQKILSASRNAIKEWDRETGECLHTFRSPSASILSAIYSPDGQKILSASRNVIKEWDRTTGKRLSTFMGHSTSVESAIYSLDGQKVLSASKDAIKEWDRETEECLRTFAGHSSSVSSAIYSPDGQKILSISWTTIKEWDRETGECLHTFAGHSSSVSSAIYSPDGQKILSVSSDDTIKEWDRRTGECLRSFKSHSRGVTGTVYSPDSQKILSTSWDATIKEWDRVTRECLRTFTGHSVGVSSAIYSPDGQKILSASSDKTVKEWDRETGECLRTFEGHSAGVNDAIHSPDGQKILSASSDKTIKEWGRETGECLRTYKGHSNGVTSVIYSSDGQKVLSASSDKTIKEWDRVTGKCLRTFKDHSNGVTSAIYSPDGQRVLSASWDDTIKEWDRETGECLRTFKGHSDGVSSAIYSPDGQRVLSASWDDTIKEWDRETGEYLHTFRGHSLRVSSAVYSSDGQKILSASWDGTIKEWDRETGECSLTMTSRTGIYIIDCSFMGCQFTNPEIEQIARVYGGKVLTPIVRTLYAKNLHGQKRDIKIKLGGESPANVVITGPNGSGKTSLLEGIVLAMEAILEDKPQGEISISFSQDNPKEAEKTLKFMCEKGNYSFLYFSNNRTHDGSFWDKLDGIKKTSKHLKSEKEFEKASELEAWLIRVEEVLKELFVDKKLRLHYEEKNKKSKVYLEHSIFYTVGDIELQLKKDKMPHGFSSALDIYSSILAHFNEDITVTPSRYQGLVIIDELESHLHVSMQKKIFPCLIKLFPGIQFIITTHSPFIISSAANSVVYDLKQQVGLSGLDAYSYKGLVEHYFKEDMYSQSTKDKYKRYTTLIDKNERSGAEKKELEEIRMYFSSLTEDIADELLLAFKMKELERGDR